MIKELVTPLSHPSYQLLDHLYLQGCIRLPLCPLKPDASTLLDRLKPTLGEFQLPHRLLTHLPALLNLKLAVLYPEGDGQDAALCRLTSEGLAALQASSEQQLQARLKSAIDVSKVIIDRAVADVHSDQSLAYHRSADFWELHDLAIEGRYGEKGEPMLLARTHLYQLDAESGLQMGGLKLKQLFRAYPETTDYLDVLENHHEDGEPAHHLYELAEAMGLPEAAGRQILIVDDFHLNPGLIGKGLGREVLRRLLIRHGKGGGLAFLPLRPYGLEQSSAAFVTACKRLSRYYMKCGFIEHPFVPYMMVGDINECTMRLGESMSDDRADWFYSNAMLKGA